LAFRSTRWASRWAPRLVLEPGADTTTEDVKALVKSRVAAYKYPRVEWFLDVVPIDTPGRVPRREIRPPANVDTPTDSTSISAACNSSALISAASTVAFVRRPLPRRDPSAAADPRRSARRVRGAQGGRPPPAEPGFRPYRAGLRRHRWLGRRSRRRGLGGSRPTDGVLKGVV
jgi:hypothetical protein